MEKHDQEEIDYLGNIWGWKWSYIGLAFILFILSLMLGRYAYLKNTGQYPVQTTTDTSLIDIKHEFHQVPRDGK